MFLCACVLCPLRASCSVQGTSTVTANRRRVMSACASPVHTTAPRIPVAEKASRRARDQLLDLRSSDSQHMDGTQLRTHAIRPSVEPGERDWQAAGRVSKSSILSDPCTGVRSPASCRVLTPRRAEGHDLERIARDRDPGLRASQTSQTQRSSAASPKIWATFATCL